MFVQVTSARFVVPDLYRSVLILRQPAELICFVLFQRGGKHHHAGAADHDSLLFEQARPFMLCALENISHKLSFQNPTWLSKVPLLLPPLPRNIFTANHIPSFVPVFTTGFSYSGRSEYQSYEKSLVTVSFFGRGFFIMSESPRGGDGDADGDECVKTSHSPITTTTSPAFSSNNTPDHPTETTNTSPEAQDDNRSQPLTPKMPIPRNTRTASFLRARSPLINQAFANQLPQPQSAQQRSTTPHSGLLGRSPPPHSYGAAVGLDPASLSPDPDPLALAEIKRIIPQIPMRAGVRDVWAMIEALRIDGLSSRPTLVRPQQQQQQQQSRPRTPRLQLIPSQTETPQTRPRTPRIEQGHDGTWDGTATATTRTLTTAAPDPVSARIAALATATASACDPLNIANDLTSPGADFDVFLQEIADCGLLDPFADGAASGHTAAY